MLVVASSSEVYKRMKQAASSREVRTTAEALKAAVADLLHSLVVHEDGPIADGNALIELYHESNRQTPTTT